MIIIFCSVLFFLTRPLATSKVSGAVGYFRLLSNYVYIFFLVQKKSYHHTCVNVIRFFKEIIKEKGISIYIYYFM